MLQVENETPFAAKLSVLNDLDGVETVFAIVKGTFTLATQPRIADEQIPIALDTEYFGEPAVSSIKQPSDVSLEKPGTDVVLLGHAHAPNGSPVRFHDVSVAVGSLGKTVRVFGDRVWRSTGGAYSMSVPDPFVVMPLVWERAFGGREETEAGATEDGRNPVGTGFRVSGGREPIEGTRLPNLEDPSQLIASWKDAPPPACFAPVAGHWLPRRSYAGTYDAEWQRTRAPYLPVDFDPRFLAIAPTGLASPTFLQGGEPVVLQGVNPDGVVQFRLPSVRLRVEFHLDGSPNVRAANLDTVVIEPEERRFSLVWRASLPTDKKTLRVSHANVALVRGG
jgi:hypothetical protein